MVLRSFLARRRRIWGYRRQDLEIRFEGPDLVPFVRDPRVTSVVLRPAVGQDHVNVELVRRDNHQWLGEWEATIPPSNRSPIPTWESFSSLMDRKQEESQSLSMLIEVNGEIAGLVSLGAVEKGAMQSGALGYWIAERWAGKGITSLATAATIDLIVGELGVHRVEVNVRPENLPSLALARKLGLREEGYKVRFMHINGQWADHVAFAVDAEDLRGRTMLGELRER